MSMRILFACCVLWGLPTAALAVTEYIQAGLVESTAAPSASTLNNDIARADDPSIETRVMALLALACALGMIAGQRDRRSRGTQLRLHNKPKKTPPTILVPPGPAPHLIPGDSPKATRRAGSTVPVLRQTPDGIPSSGLIDYIAPFSDSAEGSEATRVDYLLEAGEAEVIDISGEGGDSS
jgi:hypothetical protein